MYFSKILKRQMGRNKITVSSKDPTKRLMSCPSKGSKRFWTVQVILDGSKKFWLGPNHFGQIQIRLFWTNFYDLDLSKMI